MEMVSPSRDSKEKDKEEDDDDDNFFFFDALDHFPSDTDQSHFSHMSNSSSSPEIPSADKSLLHRRRRSSLRRISGETSSLDSSIITSETIEIDDEKKTSFGEKRSKLYRNLEDDGNQIEESESSMGSTSIVIEENNVNEEPHDSSSSSSSSSNVLVFIAGLLIKAIGIQINLFIYSISFPLLFLYQFYRFVIDPFQTIKIGRAFVVRKLFEVWEIVAALISPLIGDRLNQQNSVWKVMLRCGWGLFWSTYVCIILCSLLISALIFGGFFMRYLVEEPIKMKEILNFDYTKHSPEAYVPILPRSDEFYGQNCKGSVEIGKTQLRVFPPHHKLQVIVSLTLPESEYNRNLGVFQIRVDFLSVRREILMSSSQPCMLQFKSEPIRLLLTFLKIAPLVTGYTSESQTLNLKIRGFTEGNIPTACLRVTIEQRAEFNPGAGVPEIYDPSLILESELPLFKRIIWCWRKTIYIWISMTSFIMQLLFTLVCCRPIIFPRTRRRDGSADASSMRNSVSVQS